MIGGTLTMSKCCLSLVDLPYHENSETKPVYTSAFCKTKKKRDGFVAKVRGNIYGTIRKINRK